MPVSALPEKDGGRSQGAAEHGREKRGEHEPPGGYARQHLHADLAYLVLVLRSLRAFLGFAGLRDDLFQLARGEDRRPFRRAGRGRAHRVVATAILLVRGPQGELADADDVIVEDVLAADESVVDEG